MRWLPAVLFVFATETRAQENWPMYVAPVGCKFDYVDQYGLAETITVIDYGTFPMARTSLKSLNAVKASPRDPALPNHRNDLICSGYCETGNTAEYAHALFPIEVGNTVKVKTKWDVVTLKVTEKTTAKNFPEIETFKISVLIGGREETSVHWAPSLGFSTGKESWGTELVGYHCDIPLS